MSTLLSPLGPVSTGILWWAVTRAPDVVKLRLLHALQALPFKVSASTLTTTLKWLFGIGVVRSINAFLNRAALNNWQFRSDNEQWHWPSEVAVVTGGCSGIGEEIVKALAAKGVKVAVLDMADLPDRLKNVTAVYCKCDVSDPESVKQAAEKVRREVGTPSILLNNAGIGQDYPMLEAPLEQVKKLVEVNLISHWYTCQAFVPAMVQRNKGHIVEIASMSSFVSVGMFSDYSACKVALCAFSEGLREQLRTWYRAPNVHCTLVHPLWVSTPLVAARKDIIEKSSGKMLEPSFVAKQIADQIFSCRGSTLVIPRRMSFLSTFRSWPEWLQDAARSVNAITKEDYEKMSVSK